jgi:hypothetical protein
MAKEIEQLICDAIASKGAKDCIAVLHDADEHTEPNRQSYEKIRITCERFRKDASSDGFWGHRSHDLAWVFQ